MCLAELKPVSMSKLLKFILPGILFFVSFCSFSQVVENVNAKKVSFRFHLKKGSLTSAGAYKKDGTLLRTIWSGVKYKAGSHTAKWDGLDDQGKPVSDNNFEVKVLTSNVKYEWEGAYIGNSSVDKSGSKRLRVFDNNSIQNITSTAGKVYVASGYAEGWPAEFHFDSATANSKVWVGKTGITGSNSTHVATDGTKVFWAGFDPFQSGATESFVFVTSVADNSQLTLTNSVNAKMEWDNSSSITYKAISHKIAANSFISGLAVQNIGDKLFVTRGNQNELQVLNKNTGALITTISITNAAYVGIDNSDNLWLTRNGSILEKYTVNVNGTITSTGITITSMSLPGGFGFSPDGTTISVCDLIEFLEVPYRY